MVEKRTIIFATLAIFVWASMTTGLMAYYYLEQTKYQTQLGEKQETIDEMAENYDVSVAKRNLLSGDYGTLLGEYQWFVGDNYSSLMSKYEKLLSNLNGNYTWALANFPELNKTYTNLSDEFQTIKAKTIVTKEDFGLLLGDFYRLFNALSTKELDNFLGRISVIEISLCIDYGNLTIEWHNTSVPSGTTLFDSTRETANVQYTYWPTMEPGHVLVTSINNYAEGYWIWYYWNDAKNEWSFGPVGCDAWILKNNGVYKWVCSS